MKFQFSPPVFIIKKNIFFINVISRTIYSLPTSTNISNFWNFGRTLGLFLVIQLFSGLILASHYLNGEEVAFLSLDHIERDLFFGWIFRRFHINGARFFFLFLYLHIGRGIYYQSFKLRETWNIGVVIFLLRIATAFLGYVLPFGQMRFWGATVITNLISAIPLIGNSLVLWLWGGFSVSGPTLSRFFILHFLLPFIITGFVILHLIFLHSRGRLNPLSIERSLNLLSFSPFFIFKDLTFFNVIFFLFNFIVFFLPYKLGDPENFIEANPLKTPPHIVPEWYFLASYANLRAIPNKILGVLVLLISNIILLFPSFLSSCSEKGNLPTAFNFNKRIIFWNFIVSFIFLTFLGSIPVEEPFLLLSQVFVFLYFSLFILYCL